MPATATVTATATMANTKSNSKSKKATNKTKEWTKWISSFATLDSFSNSNQQQQQQQQQQRSQVSQTLPQHELQHVKSLPTPPSRYRINNSKSNNKIEDKQVENTPSMVRSSSYALKRTGTLTPQVPWPFSATANATANDGDNSEDGIEFKMQKLRPPSIQTSSRKELDKRKVSFSSIQIYASTTQSLSPSSTLTPDRFAEDDGSLWNPSERDALSPTATFSIDAFEANRSVHPIPYHLRFAPPSEIPAKEELRQASSLMDSSPTCSSSKPAKHNSNNNKKKKMWQLPRLGLKKAKSTSTSRKSWNRRSNSSKNRNLPIRVIDATHPNYIGTHINMAGIVSRPDTYTNYEDMYST
ncbi:MAG: hypothetical protein SGBAC_012298 [Bacillariaceae sp.]